MSDSPKNEQISTRDEAPQEANRAKTGQTADPAAPGHVAEEPSGYRGENPSTAGMGGTGIRSVTPENARGHLNPSAPGDTGTTPGTTPQE
ncbi:hypothetical protein [Terriglobus aquaticus]|uniref:Uncharacterized protein n=1 Tax=Terriglobus aquaticus TaxID=940139 RepID=A0ABW9KHN4_9BACT|nr:hypothetical protein [Terriglobus aquaticus]